VIPRQILKKILEMPSFCGYLRGVLTSDPNRKEAFRVSGSRTQRLKDRKRNLLNRKQRIAYRLRERHWEEQGRPMFVASNIHYELTAKDRGLGEGGIGAMHLLARCVGLIEGIDRELHLL